MLNHIEWKEYQGRFDLISKCLNDLKLSHQPAITCISQFSKPIFQEKIISEDDFIENLSNSKMKNDNLVLYSFCWSDHDRKIQDDILYKYIDKGSDKSDSDNDFIVRNANSLKCM